MPSPLVSPMMVWLTTLGPQMTPTILPVPACPGSGAYPGLVCTITICVMFPEIIAPVGLRELDPITAITGGMLLGGAALLPGSAAPVPPQVGLGLLFSKPLKLAGAGPPLRELAFDHCAPQKVTLFPTTAFWFPMTKAPPTGSGTGVAVGVRVGVLVGVGVAVTVGVTVEVASWPVTLYWKRGWGPSTRAGPSAAGPALPVSSWLGAASTGPTNARHMPMDSSAAMSALGTRHSHRARG